MASLEPGFFTITPEDLEGREIVTVVRTDSKGDQLVAEFKATIHMEMSAFQRLAKERFKRPYWLSDKP